MIRRAFLQTPEDEETRSIARGLGALGVPVELFPAKRLRRGQLPVTRDTLVAGETDVVNLALRQLGVDAPEPDDYPQCLRPFLERRLTESTVGRVLDAALEGTSSAVFVKPKGRVKRFTGFVLGGPDDIHRLEGTSRGTAVHCGEVVAWRSEWRVYVVRGAVVGRRLYKGQTAIALDDATVARAVETYQASGRAPAGYGMDLGVLENGRTALVEVNDGYGLGNYGLEDALYTDLIVSRWLELTSH